MIIKSSSISSKSNPSALIRYLLNTENNERVDVLFGTEFDIEDAFHDTKARGYTNAVRHIKLSPAIVELTVSQAIQAAKQIAEEFKGDPESVIVIRHTKQRIDPDAAKTHFHIIIPELNHMTRKIMETGWSYARNEKLARIFEIQFGDKQVVGRFNKAVKNALLMEGKYSIAETIQIPDELPVSAFTSIKHQILKEKGINLPKIKNIVTNSFNIENSVDDFKNKLSEHGLAVAHDGKNWIIQTSENKLFIGIIYRLTKTKKKEIDEFFNNSVL